MPIYLPFINQHLKQRKANQKTLTILQTALPSVPPQQQCSASQNSGLRGRHGP